MNQQIYSFNCSLLRSARIHQRAISPVVRRRNAPTRPPGRMLLFCRQTCARNNSANGHYFLDAIASLDFKLSVSEGCFSASASSGLLELFFGLFVSRIVLWDFLEKPWTSSAASSYAILSLLIVLISTATFIISTFEVRNIVSTALLSLSH